MHHLDRFSGILRTTVLCLGIWAFYAQVSVLIGRSLNGLISGAWIPTVVIALVLLATRRWQAGTTPAGPDAIIHSANPLKVLFLGLCSVTLMFFLPPGNPIAASVYVICAIAGLMMLGDHFSSSTFPSESSSAGKQTALVLAVLVAAVIVTLCEHRVNWDDAKYLHTVVTTLAHPNEPLLVYEHLHGVSGLKILHPSMRLQTYELLVAAISKISRVSHLNVYYLILPPIFAAFSVIAQWIFIRRLSRNPGLSLVATFLLLVVWGSYRSYGAFAFDFVGRGIFVTFGIPAMICATFEFIEKRDWASWLYLFCAVWTGCLLTSTAFAVAPVAVLLVLLASYGFERNRIREFFLAVLTISWCPILLAYVVIVAPIVPPLDVDTAGGVLFVFGKMQGRIAFIFLGLAPFFSLLGRSQSGPWLLRYTALCFLILLSDVLLRFVGHYSSILSWRLLWAIPVPIIIGIGISACIKLCQDFIYDQKLRAASAIVLLVMVVGAFYITGNTVVFRNFGWPSVKIDKSAYPVARTLAQCSTAQDLMLAPPEIAVPLAGLQNAPSLIAVRGHHLSYLESQLGSQESERRKRLFNIVQGEQNSAEDVQWMRQELLYGSINRVVLDRGKVKLEPLKQMLQSLNVDKVELGDFEVWLPNTSAKEAMRLQTCVKTLDER